ncbi:hypothetical protein CfE428DRAFT_3618 [Chthoniobacter flavus Ellin428]|uniref:Lipoprotein n=1 Tax=Chthoniobacter flavus Ellin428 TaxID=497964 RepID=B4D3Y0_9BACT|nr:hypothetical protein [Chthoniobacter flavus]EDY18960.1 hypothetical protein CfE428DRAFT_3618 [Chthoniobacter flavus Ellin428]TCO93544.1 hypothetical protein EV701_104248 [Chthoniobacter flavus]
MSRPFRFLLPAVFVASAVGLTGCVGTIYDNTYSYHKNHFVPPREDAVAHGKEPSAEALLGDAEKNKPATDAGSPAGLPPAGEIPGLPPAAAPGAPAAPDAAAPAPAPAAPPAPATPPPK